MDQQVIKNRFNFFELKNIPSEKEIKDYYTLKYYQEDKGLYQKVYSDDELEHTFNKLEQKFFIIKNNLKIDKGSFLDIGCGEGWALKFFKEKSWEVAGLDFSDVGCQKHNPEHVKDIILGDINQNIDQLIEEKKTFDVIWLDNVLEHVVSPLSLLKKCYQLANENSILVIEVPNDFSTVQNQLMKKGCIKKEFWVVVPDHISYFNKEGLIEICKASDWRDLEVIGDFPIDLNLFNPNTNYIENKSVGKSCHLARVEIENLMHSISVEKINNLFKALIDLGIGRQITGFFKKQ